MHPSTLLAAALLAADPAPSPPALTLGGYAEGYYQWNFGRPQNGITNYRGFDNRSNAFTLSNVALDARWNKADVEGRLTLQVGSTPSTYYLAEPALPGSAGANASGGELWKYLQQAYVGYRFPLGAGLTVTAGLFLSPIGPENMAVKDNWNYSRSNLFFGLPFYHSGVRATYPLSGTVGLTLAAYNGWNSVVDNNAEKSLSAQLLYSRDDKLAVSVIAFSGVERPTGAPEGRAWRHLFDVHATWNISSRWSVIAHANAGLEPNTFGTSSWLAGALYGRVKVLDPLFVAVRVDTFREHRARNADAAASAIFWPVAQVSSATATVDYRPAEYGSIRLELRRDLATQPLYFAGGAAAPNALAQTTLTLGATTWF